MPLMGLHNSDEGSGVMYMSHTILFLLHLPQSVPPSVIRFRYDSMNCRFQCTSECVSAWCGVSVDADDLAHIGIIQHSG